MFKSESLYTDPELLQQLKFGSRDAFTTLYHRYHRGIYHYLLGFVKSPQLAEDLVHEVFIKIWEGRERITINTSFSSYLYRICHNKAIDTLKKIAQDAAMREEVLLWMELESAESALEDKGPTQYERIYRDAIDALSPQRRRIFILCREQGKSYAEAAAELGISRHTVKEHMSLSLRFLRAYVADRMRVALSVVLLWAKFL